MPMLARRNAARRPLLSIVTIPVGPSVLDPVSISLQGGLPEISWTDTGTSRATLIAPTPSWAMKSRISAPAARLVSRPGRRRATIWPTIIR